MQRGAACCSLVIAAWAHASEPRAEFLWRFEIKDVAPSGEVFLVKVPDAMYDGAQSFPNDIRVFGGDGTSWSFFPWSPPASDEPAYVSSKWESKAAEDVSGPFKECLVSVSSAEGEETLHNRIVVSTSGSDFVRRVTLSGSADGESWVPVGEGYLVDQAHGARVRNQAIDYRPCTLPQLRVCVYPNARDASESFEIRDVALQYLVPAATRLEEVPLAKSSDEKHEEREGVQSLFFDTGARNRPLRELRISGERDEYAMPVKVYGRNDETNAWRWVADGGIHRNGEQVRDVVSVNGSSFRHVRIDLYHYEDRPFEAVSVKAWRAPQYLVIESKGGSAKIYAGSPRVTLPRFDLQFRIASSKIAATAEKGLGERRHNPYHLVIVLRSYGKWLIWAGVGVVLLLVGLAIAKKIRAAA